MTTPFLVPAVAERPALFGLPDLRTCAVRVYGYFSYPRALYEQGAAPRLPAQALLDEARRLGFRGYLDVTIGGWTRHAVAGKS